MISQVLMTSDQLKKNNNPAKTWTTLSSLIIESSRNKLFQFVLDKITEHLNSLISKQVNLAG